MTEEEKQLLLQDLCARLPYGVKCLFKDEVRVINNESAPYFDCELSPRDLEIFLKSTNFHIKPYLRPMSSMTEEEHQELSRLVNDDKLLTGDPAKTVCLHCGVVIDFHNSHHLDWRGLIEKGLALEAPEDMYK